jgi:hypothetical protein
VEAVQKTDPVEFKWIDGAHSTTPPENFTSYFGAPPYYRFFQFDGVSALDTMVTKIREMPVGVSAEDTIRKMINEDELASLDAIRSTLDSIFKIIDDDPSIDVSLPKGF